MLKDSLEITLPELWVDYRIYSSPTPLDVSKIVTEMKLLNEQLETGYLQLVDESRIIDEQQLLSACWHASYAFYEEMNISRSMDVETLLYLAGTRQIDQALEIVGLKEQTKIVLLVNVQRTPEEVMRAFELFEGIFQWPRSERNSISRTPDELVRLLSLYMRRDMDTGIKKQVTEKKTVERIRQHWIDWMMSRVALTATLV